MVELSRGARRLLLVAHVVTSVGWLGAGAANLTLAASACLGSSELSPHSAYLAVELLDTWVVIPAAFATLLIGVVLSACTSWGLVRHWWVVIKLALTCAIILFSTFGVGVWVEDLVGQTQLAAPDRTAQVLVLGAIGNLTGFVFMTWLSVAKPKGRTPWSASVPDRRARSRRNAD